MFLGHYAVAFGAKRAAPAVSLGTLFALGLAIYLGATRARDRVGSWGLGIFVIFLLAIYAASAFGPPPPSADAIAWSDMGQWLVIFWAAWMDRHWLTSSGGRFPQFESPVP